MFFGQQNFVLMTHNNIIEYQIIDKKHKSHLRINETKGLIIATGF